MQQREAEMLIRHQNELASADRAASAPPPANVNLYTDGNAEDVGAPEEGAAAANESKGEYFSLFKFLCYILCISLAINIISVDFN